MHESPYSAQLGVNRERGGGLGISPAAGRRDRAARSGSNRGWWPDQLDLTSLRRHRAVADPMGEDFDYAAAFRTLDVDALARDVDAVLTTSQEWWPADFGHYGPLMVRMTWHCAGTYRAADGRGGAGTGMARFAPLNSWPDNRNLDKARRLLWPVKKKHGAALSWADLMVFAGTRALEIMGLRTFGFAGGRADVYESDEAVSWGPERAWLGDERHRGVRELDAPLAADQMGLIYVNPEGPNTVPDPVMSGRDIRRTFGAMGFDDEETVALIVGGHTFGKTHGAADPARHLGPEPEGAPLEEQGLGWRGGHGTGTGPDTVSSGLEGTWTATPTRWDNSYLETLFGHEWDVALSPAKLWQWVPRDGGGAGTVPDAHDPSRTHSPTFLTTDLALRFDPGFAPVARRFLENPDQLADAFARVWFKLTHLDMGPVPRYLGPLVPPDELLWQDRVPPVDHPLVDADDAADLKRRVLDSDLTVAQLVSAAWASASTFRISDKRGGANGARIRLAPQRDWEVNDPDTLALVLDTLEGIRDAARSRGTTISLADLVVLAGGAAVEEAARKAGHDVTVPFTPGRTDASQEQTDAESFAALEPDADGFRNYRGGPARLPSERLLVDRASLLTLTAPEMTVLVGGLRVLGANSGRSPLGVLTATPGVLTNDFFVNLLDMDTEWGATSEDGAPPGSFPEVFEGRDRATGDVRWTAGRVDLVLGSNSELRAVAEVYAADDAREKFVHDFVAAWSKVMDLDRYDLI